MSVEFARRRVSPERTGWRDEAISARHREWGFDCPGVDIDFLITEYDGGMSVAVVDYKCCDRGEPRPLTSANARALSTFSDRFGRTLPAVVAYYWSQPYAFVAKPINDTAAFLFGSPCEWMSERAWVQRLYAMRGRELPRDIAVTLDTSCPPSDQAMRWFGPSTDVTRGAGSVFRYIDPWRQDKGVEMIPRQPVPPVYERDENGDLREIPSPAMWKGVI